MADASKSQLGLVGLAVMGENLVLNFASKGYKVSVFNRTVKKVTDFVEGRGKDKSIVGCTTTEEFCASLASPRVIIMMVKAGDPVDQLMSSLLPYLEKGDILIDGGNSHYPDSIRRTKAMKERGIHFVGMGVSGGEEGALLGPSIMPGGASEAWPTVKPLLQSVCAKVEDGSPCCEWVGEDGAGHFVKMVHNGIEYGDMQLISESYAIMENVLGMTPPEMAKVFKEWNTGDLDSFLVEITGNIMEKVDEESGKPLVDVILDKAGQKGTGKWTAQVALELGQPVTLIGEAVFARCLSSLKDERVNASSILSGPAVNFKGDKQETLKKLGEALYAAKIISYAQGFLLMKAAAAEYNWNLDFGAIALMWRGGCIIRSKFLSKITEAYRENGDLPSLLLAPFFKSKLEASIQSFREVVALAVMNGVSIPALSTALSFFDGYRSARLPANVIQAQRDYFGAHMYERVDKKRGEFFHTNWTGRGGSTASTAYNA